VQQAPPCADAIVVRGHGGDGQQGQAQRPAARCGRVGGRLQQTDQRSAVAVHAADQPPVAHEQVDEDVHEWPLAVALVACSHRVGIQARGVGGQERMTAKSTMRRAGHDES
jgi:hypothetical protein